MELETADRYRLVIDEIAGFSWHSLTAGELARIAWAYYFFSVQFRESLVIACDLHPYDEQLQDLKAGECDTDNLSPFPGIAEAGERMHHDEFMRRVLMLSGVMGKHRTDLEQIGQAYLTTTRKLSLASRAMSIATYEDGGLEAVFRAILRATDWNGPIAARLPAFPGRTYPLRQRRSYRPWRTLPASGTGRPGPAALDSVSRSIAQRGSASFPQQKPCSCLKGFRPAYIGRAPADSTPDTAPCFRRAPGAPKSTIG